MATLFCATAMSLRHACFTSARPMPVTGGQHCASAPPSIRNFSAASALRKLQANAAEAQSWYSRARDLGTIDAKRQLNSLETRQGK